MLLTKKSISSILLIHKKISNYNELNNLYKILKKNINNDLIYNLIIKYNDILNTITINDNYKLININNEYYNKEINYKPYITYIKNNNNKLRFEQFIYKYHSNIEFQNYIDDNYSYIINSNDKYLDKLLELVYKYYFISIDIKLYF